MYHFDHITALCQIWLPTSPVWTPCAMLRSSSCSTQTFQSSTRLHSAEAVFAKSMQTFWTNFAKSDTPQSDGAITWPAFNGSERALRFTADPVNTVDAARYAPKCSFGTSWATNDP